MQIILRDPLKIRLAEWQSDADLTAGARKVFGQPEARYMLDVLRNEHPGHSVLEDAMPPNVRLVFQGRAEGYEMALNNLEAMAQYRQPHAPLPPATFEEPEKE